MIQIDYRDRSPIYEQIREKMKELIIKGILKPDERIPSVREQAQALTINPNTIQKAYRELEDRGYIYSIRGKGSFAASAEQWIDDRKLVELNQSFEKIVTEMVLFGVDKEQLVLKINTIYRREEGGQVK